MSEHTTIPAPPECNADERGCTAGPDGEPCAACLASRDLAMADARRSYAVATLAERDPEAYRAQTRDAGRAHLLGEDER
jgi:hypothetical protein